MLELKGQYTYWLLPHHSNVGYRHFEGECSMASWKLLVKDYGKIKSAEIEMAPLTLFVGDNNSGKSFLLSLLWGIENLGIQAILGNFNDKEDEM